LLVGAGGTCPQKQAQQHGMDRGDTHRQHRRPPSLPSQGTGRSGKHAKP
jgi:hypothetical protein